MYIKLICRCIFVGIAVLIIGMNNWNPDFFFLLKFLDVGYLKFASSFCRKLMEATLVDGNGMETRHIIVTTIGGKWSAQFKRV